MRVFGDGKGFIVGSMEGRCGVEYADFSKQDLNSKDSFCFKSHREESGDTATVYSVTQIAFNKKYNTFVTCGNDG